MGPEELLIRRPALEGRHHAARVHALGAEVRALADRAFSAGAVPWQSVAAEGFRHRLAEERVRLARTATALDDAAEALVRHAVALERSLPGWLR